MEVGVFANVNEFVFVHDPTAYEPRHLRWHDDTDFGALCRIPTVTLTRVLLASPLANMLRVEWHYGVAILFDNESGRVDLTREVDCSSVKNDDACNFGMIFCREDSTTNLDYDISK